MCHTEATLIGYIYKQKWVCSSPLVAIEDQPTFSYQTRWFEQYLSPVMKRRVLTKQKKASSYFKVEWAAWEYKISQ